MIKKFPLSFVNKSIKPEAGSWKLEIGNWKLEVGS